MISEKTLSARAATSAAETAARWSSMQSVSAQMFHDHVLVKGTWRATGQQSCLPRVVKQELSCHQWAKTSSLRPNCMFMMASWSA